MKKIWLFLCLLLPVSCDIYKNYDLDGMWQLKTVQENGGNPVTVDTVYYSFHREVIFSFTVLKNSTEALYPIYGYMDMPSNNNVHILIDKKSAGKDDFVRFLHLSGWSSADLVFDIKKYNKSDLVLYDGTGKKTFTLKKF